jgi:tetratricopeptide (TPR) repeat protein
MLRHCLAARRPAPTRLGRLSGQESGRGFLRVYQRLGVLPVSAARDPAVWLRLEELKREPCDQKSISDLALLLDKLGYRREAADGLYRFVKDYGAPLYALNQSANIYLKLTDYAKAVEVADEYVRRAPSDSNARYLRGVALDGIGDFQRALADYSDAIDRTIRRGQKTRVESRVPSHGRRLCGAQKVLRGDGADQHVGIA